VHAFGKLEAVEPARPHIGDDSIRVLGKSDLQRLRSRRRLEQAMSAMAQQRAEEFATRRAVVDDQDRRHGHHTVESVFTASHPRDRNSVSTMRRPSRNSM